MAVNYHLRCGKDSVLVRASKLADPLPKCWPMDMGVKTGSEKGVWQYIFYMPLMNKTL